jgi:uncharacterized protein YdeI (YjbR/CyaY-like superfamily)
VRKPQPQTPRFFRRAQELKAWLEAHHDKEDALLVGFRKKHKGQPSITYPEALDLALAFGWIDGVRKSIDAESYMIRFTPRRPKSVWSLVNIRRVGELKALGRMRPAGLKAFATRDPEMAARYSYERENAQLSSTYRKRFQANARAWAFFVGQPGSYQRPASWWVMSAKKEETRERRLKALIAASAKASRLPKLLGQTKEKGRAAKPPI